MRAKKFLSWLIIVALGVWFFSSFQSAQAGQSLSARTDGVNAFDLIIAMNTLRVSNGLPALVEDPIVDAVAQSTAETMAANQMSWHIGDVRGRLAAAGYGGGGTVWATENFAVGSRMGLDDIMSVWADPDHMRPATTAAYCHVGAGVAKAANGMTYYILQAAYTAGQACGSASTSSSGTASQSGTGSATGAGTTSGSGFVSQVIVPVKIATPDADGKIYHVVQAGQSFWSIAIAYQLKIADLETWNNISRNVPLYTGQRLFIPGKNTAGYATPTPVGMIVPSAPDADGRIVHVVQPYQVLIAISAAYNVSIERILLLNGLQKDWPLQVGQKLLISPGNVTPSATLSAIQKLTPDADGKYYHVVQSGQTLSWIAGRYNIPLVSLMAWNGLNSASIIRPNQKLLLMVTPPVTATFTPGPPTETFTPEPTMTLTLVSTSPTPTSTSAPKVSSSRLWIGLVFFVVAIAIVGLVWFWFFRKR
jgi:LysM repeat protein